ncbi:MAG: adenylate/guanylate cyclase domain-containing protein [Ignavibacteriae bacterium]|nr:adenylate/guanylate cyclase domain-containing protein [Ignavibacteriota bacterium]
MTNFFRKLTESSEPHSGDTSRSMLKRLTVSFSIALSVILFTHLTEFPPLQRIELSTIDFRFRQRGPMQVPQESLDVVIVEISNESFKSLPEQWPWPRSYHAQVVRNLKRAGAVAIGFDILMSEPDARNTANDDDFRKTIRETKMVALGGKTDIGNQGFTMRTSEETYGNIFFSVDSSIGIVYIRNDDDGVYRRYRPFTFDPAAERKLPSLAFATLNKAFNNPPFFTAENFSDKFLYAEKIIPKADDVSFLINYYGPDRTFKHVNYADVIDDSDFTTVDELSIVTGDIPGEDEEEINTFDDPDFGLLYDGTFAGKIVLVGSTLPEDKDLFPVPIATGKQSGDNLMYGVEIHANAIQNVLDETALYKESWWLDVLLIVVLSLLVFYSTTWLKVFRFRWHAYSEILSALFTLMLLAGILLLAQFLFNAQYYVLTMVNPMLAVVVSYIGATVYNYLGERKQKTYIKGLFSRYVSPAVVNSLIENPDRVRLGGEKKELTVFFSDVAGFTSISEQLSPEELVQLLNEYLSEMTALVFKHDGTLDKFVGDAVMAIWGAPLPQRDHALRACKAALEMQEVIFEMNRRWKKEGKPELGARAGINTGDMIVGNMGGARRFDYTVIGDNVNLASRLESANKQYGSRIMIAERTYQLVASEVLVRELDSLVVKGKTQPVKVYELLSFAKDPLPPHGIKFLDVYNRSLELYKHREWEHAITSFEQARKLLGEDYTSKMYISRCRHYINEPPADDWDGAFVLKTK